jgi:hypothetical protein
MIFGEYSPQTARGLPRDEVIYHLGIGDLIGVDDGTTLAHRSNFTPQWKVYAFL